MLIFTTFTVKLRIMFQELREHLSIAAKVLLQLRRGLTVDNVLFRQVSLFFWECHGKASCAGSPALTTMITEVCMDFWPAHTHTHTLRYDFMIKLL